LPLLLFRLRSCKHPFLKPTPSLAPSHNPSHHPNPLFNPTQVTGVAQRLIAALGEGHGGGYQKHLRSFKWEVAVVKQPVMNAFVFPGGKICVYTGLLDLLRRDADLLAMVMG